MDELLLNTYRWALVALDLGVDTTTPAGKMLATMLSAFAQIPDVPWTPKGRYVVMREHLELRVGGIGRVKAVLQLRRI